MMLWKLVLKTETHVKFYKFNNVIIFNKIY